MQKCFQAFAYLSNISSFFSVGYSKDDVEYRWTKGRGVNIASDMKMSQFDLIKTPTGNATVEVNKGKVFILTCQN